MIMPVGLDVPKAIGWDDDVVTGQVEQIPAHHEHTRPHVRRLLVGFGHLAHLGLASSDGTVGRMCMRSGTRRWARLASPQVAD